MNPKDQKRIVELKPDIDASKELYQNVKLFKHLNIAMPSPVSDNIDKTFPSSLEALTMGSLIDYLALYTREFAYSAWLASMAKAEMIILDREIDLMSSKEYFLAEGNTTDKRAAKGLAEATIKATKEKVEAEAKYTMLNAVATINEKYIFAISRQISILQGEMNMR
jgi:hypothetical protein